MHGKVKATLCRSFRRAGPLLCVALLAALDSGGTATGSLNNGHSQHTATLLLNGSVLVAGGSSTSSAEIYNPATAKWTVTTSLNAGREAHTATLLTSGQHGGHVSEGQVLVAGGNSGSTSLNSSEFFDTGEFSTLSSLPAVNTVTRLSATSEISLSGSGFGGTGASEGSSGSSNNSASNIPVVQLRSLCNDQVQTVTLDPSQGFFYNSFNGLAPGSTVPGYMLLTMIVNGTPSVSQIVPYTEAQSISNFPSTQTLSETASPVTLPAKTSDGTTVTYTVQSGPATVSGDTLTFTGVGTVVVMATATGNSTYAALSDTDTITVTPTPTDTPTMPEWGVGLLALLLMAGRG